MKMCSRRITVAEKSKATTPEALFEHSELLLQEQEKAEEEIRLKTATQKGKFG